MHYTELAKKIKQKNPNLISKSDMEVAQGYIKSNPQFANKVSFSNLDTNAVRKSTIAPNSSPNPYYKSKANTQSKIVPNKNFSPVDANKIIPGKNFSPATSKPKTYAEQMSEINANPNLTKKQKVARITGLGLEERAGIEAEDRQYWQDKINNSFEAKMNKASQEHPILMGVPNFAMDFTGINDAFIRPINMRREELAEYGSAQEFEDPMEKAKRQTQRNASGALGGLEAGLLATGGAIGNATAKAALGGTKAGKALKAAGIELSNYSKQIGSKTLNSGAQNAVKLKQARLAQNLKNAEEAYKAKLAIPHGAISGSTAFGAISAPHNINAVIQGEQTPQQAVINQGISMVLGATVGAGSKIINPALEKGVEKMVGDGASKAVQSATNQAANNGIEATKPMLDKAAEEGAKQAESYWGNVIKNTGLGLLEGVTDTATLAVSDYALRNIPEAIAGEPLGDFGEHIKPFLSFPALGALKAVPSAVKPIAPNVRNMVEGAVNKYSESGAGNVLRTADVYDSLGIKSGNEKVKKAQDLNRTLTDMNAGREDMLHQYEQMTGKENQTLDYTPEQNRAFIENFKNQNGISLEDLPNKSYEDWTESDFNKNAEYLRQNGSSEEDINNLYQEYKKAKQEKADKQNKSSEMNDLYNEFLKQGYSPEEIERAFSEEFSGEDVLNNIDINAEAKNPNSLYNRLLARLENANKQKEQVNETTKQTVEQEISNAIKETRNKENQPQASEEPTTPVKNNLGVNIPVGVKEPQNGAPNGFKINKLPYEGAKPGETSFDVLSGSKTAGKENIYKNVDKSIDYGRTDLLSPEQLEELRKIQKEYTTEVKDGKVVFKKINGGKQNITKKQLKAWQKQFRNVKDEKLPEGEDISFTGNEQAVKDALEDMGEDTLRYQEGLEHKAEDTSLRQFASDDADFNNFWKEWNNGEAGGSTDILEKKLNSLRTDKERNYFFDKIRKQQEFEKKKKTAKKPGEENEEYDDLAVEKELTDLENKGFDINGETEGEKYEAMHTDKVKGIQKLHNYIRSYAQKYKNIPSVSRRILEEAKADSGTEYELRKALDEGNISEQNIPELENGLNKFFNHIFKQNITVKDGGVQGRYNAVFDFIENENVNDRAKQYQVELMNKFVDENGISVEKQVIDAAKNRKEALGEIRNKILEYKELEKEYEKASNDYYDIPYEERKAKTEKVKDALKKLKDAEKKANIALGEISSIIRNKHLNKNNPDVVKYWQLRGMQKEKHIANLIKRKRYNEAIEELNKYKTIMSIGIEEEIGGKEIQKYEDVYNGEGERVGTKKIGSGKTWNSDLSAPEEGKRVAEETINKFVNDIYKGLKEDRSQMGRFDFNVTMENGNINEIQQRILDRITGETKANEFKTRNKIDDEIKDADGYGDNVKIIDNNTFEKWQGAKTGERTAAKVSKDGTIMIDPGYVKESDIDTMRNIIERRGGGEQEFKENWKEVEDAYQFLNEGKEITSDIELTVKDLAKDDVRFKDLTDAGKGDYKVKIKDLNDASTGNFDYRKKTISYNKNAKEITKDDVDHEVDHARRYEEKYEALYSLAGKINKKFVDFVNTHGVKRVRNVVNKIEKIKKGIDESKIKVGLDEVLDSLGWDGNYKLNQSTDNLTTANFVKEKPDAKSLWSQRKTIRKEALRIKQQKIKAANKYLENLFNGLTKEEVDIYNEYLQRKEAYDNTPIEYLGQRTKEYSNISTEEYLNNLKDANYEQWKEIQDEIERYTEQRSTNATEDKHPERLNEESGGQGSGETGLGTLPSQERDTVGRRGVETPKKSYAFSSNKDIEAELQEAEKNGELNSIDINRDVKNTKDAVEPLDLDGIDEAIHASSKWIGKADALEKKRAELFGTTKQFERRKKMLGSKRYVSQKGEGKGEDYGEDYRRGKVGIEGKSSYGWKLKNANTVIQNLKIEEVKTKHLEKIDDYIKGITVKPSKDGVAPSGYEPYNMQVLNQAIYGNMPKAMYDYILKSDGKFTGKLEGDQLAYAKTLRNMHNSKVDGYIPKAVVNKLLSRGVVPPSEAFKILGKKAGLKATARALSELSNDLFKTTVLPTISFIENNVIGDTTFNLSSANNVARGLKNYIDAVKLKNEDIPPRVIDNYISEVSKSTYKKTYFGVKGIDDFCNLLKGEPLRNTDVTKEMKKWTDEKGSHEVEVTKRKANWKNRLVNSTLGLPQIAFKQIYKGIMRINSDLSNLQRKAQFVNQVKEQIIDAKKVQKTAQKMITLQEAVKYMKSRPELETSIIDGINEVLGNYSNFSPTEQNVIKQLIPFYSWERTVLRNTIYMAKKRPGRLAIMLAYYNMVDNRDKDKAEWQRGSVDIPESLATTRKGSKVVINKSEQLPLNTNRKSLNAAWGMVTSALKGDEKELGKSSLELTYALTSKFNPRIRLGLESTVGRKFFADGSVLSKGEEDDKYSYRKNPKTGKKEYYNKETKEFVGKKMPVDLAGRYYATNMIRQHGGFLGNNLTNPAQWIYAANNEGELPDKISDVSLLRGVEKEDGLTKEQKYWKLAGSAMQKRQENYDDNKERYRKYKAKHKRK